MTSTSQKFVFEQLATHLRGWWVGGRDVADDGGEVLCPEGALPLAVVPQRRRVLGAVDG